MRILLACEFYYPSIGGVQEVMRQVGERLAAAGHEVIIATTELPERRTREIRGVRVEGFRVSGNLVRGMRGEIDRYREYVLRGDYDVLLIKAAQQWTFDALTPVLDSITRPKMFIPCGFSGMYDPSYADYFKRMPGWLRKFDRLIFYASDYRDIDLARSNGLANLEIISNGADEREFNTPRDPAFRARHGIPEDAFVVLTVGSLTGFKGHLELATAFEKCALDVPACLLLVGNRPRRASRVPPWVDHALSVYRSAGANRLARWAIRSVLENLGFGWLFTRLGYPPWPAALSAEAAVKAVVKRIKTQGKNKAILLDPPRHEVIQAYLNSDLFVFASRIEYSPLVLFEAAAAGLPFVSVPVGNAEEISRWTGGGTICPAQIDAQGYTNADVHELAAAISRLAKDPATRSALGAQGRRSWENNYTWERIARRYEDIIKRCLIQRDPQHAAQDQVPH